jgi:hypothetical protein
MRTMLLFIKPYFAIKHKTTLPSIYPRGRRARVLPGGRVIFEAGKREQKGSVSFRGNVTPETRPAEGPRRTLRGFAEGKTQAQTAQRFGRASFRHILPARAHEVGDGALLLEAMLRKALIRAGKTP